jgi:hypothetical protein
MAGNELADAGEPDGGAADLEAEVVVSILGVAATPGANAAEITITIQTNHGDLEVLLNPSAGETNCAIFIGTEGAEGVYSRLASGLVDQGLTSLRIRPRVPGEFSDGVIDVLAACSFLKGIGGETAIVIGHSYAGAVAVKSGVISPFICGVAALAPQRFGTQGVESLGKPLLLIHGSDDQVLPPLASDDIFQRAQGDKQMVIIDGAGHSFRDEGERLHELLKDFILRVVADREPGE